MIPFEQTRDETEITFQIPLSRFFPSYKVFWETYVATRYEPDLKILAPYLLKIRETQEGQFAVDEAMYNKWREVTYLHWSVFCSLGGALYHGQIAKQNWESWIGDAAPQEKVASMFRLFEHFHCAYVRMDTAQEVAGRFANRLLRWKSQKWGAVKDLDQCATRHVCSEKVNKLSQSIRERIIKPRNFMAHYMTLPASLRAGGFFVPDGAQLPEKDSRNYESLDAFGLLIGPKPDGKWMEMCKKMEGDFELIAQYCETVDQLMLKEMRELVDRGLVQVEYSTGKTKAEWLEEIQQSPPGSGVRNDGGITRVGPDVEAGRNFLDLESGGKRGPLSHGSAMVDDSGRYQSL